MSTRQLKSFLLAFLVVVTADAQDVRTGRTALRSATMVLDAVNIKTIQFSGSGWNADLGQSYSASDDWPRFEVTNFSRTIDFEAKFVKDEFTRRQGKFPPRGGGATPIQGEQQHFLLSLGEFAWNLENKVEVPAVPDTDVRQLDILLSPYGFLKAATAANAKGIEWNVGNKKFTIVSFTALGKYRVNGTISDNLVERVQTWVPNPVLGDMLYEYQYSDYKDFNGVKFPATVRLFEGDSRLNSGHSAMEIQVHTVKANVDAGVPSAAPFAVRQAYAPGIMNETQRRQGLIKSVGDKVWVIGGGTLSSVVVEFKDFLAVIEAPVDEERSLWVLPEVHRLAPEKPIRYVVNTHHHFDFAGGLRTYVAQGTTVITHESNRQFYQDVLFYPAPRTFQPDLLSLFYPAWSPDRMPDIKTVGSSKYTVTDGTRNMDIYAIQGLAHSGDMLVAYLPAEKILVNAELYCPRPAEEPPPSADASMRTLYDNIRRLKLDVSMHVPIRGVPGPNSDFLKILGNPNE
jgi:glyoxylase-like metal-dependent hydrolase (beta-lactamase superfamily II)